MQLVSKRSADKKPLNTLRHVITIFASVLMRLITFEISSKRQTVKLSRDTLHASAVCDIIVCLSVCLSVCHTCRVKTVYLNDKILTAIPIFWSSDTKHRGAVSAQRSQRGH